MESDKSDKVEGKEKKIIKADSDDTLKNIKYLGCSYSCFELKDSNAKYLKMLYLDNGNKETGDYELYDKENYDLDVLKKIVKTLSKIKKKKLLL